MWPELCLDEIGSFSSPGMEVNNYFSRLTAVGYHSFTLLEVGYLSSPLMEVAYHSSTLVEVGYLSSPLMEVGYPSSPFMEVGYLSSPLSKGGLRGDVESGMNLPQPLLGKDRGIKPIRSVCTHGRTTYQGRGAIHRACGKTNHHVCVALRLSGGGLESPASSDRPLLAAISHRLSAPGVSYR
jgi:hypothetical protein